MTRVTRTTGDRSIQRPWTALVGLATLPLMRASATHHFVWLTQQATTNRAWWNRGVHE
jgi:hypothetical protein